MNCDDDPSSSTKDNTGTCKKRKVNNPKKKKKNHGGKFCAAYDCGNDSYSFPKRSFHSFPNPVKFPDLYDQWVRAVRKRRANWNGPSPLNFGYTVLCSDHFDPDDFEPINEVQKQLGYKIKAILKENAVPTKFKLRTHDQPDKPKRSKSALTKLDAARANSVPGTSLQTTPDNEVSMDDFFMDEPGVSNRAVQVNIPPPKKYIRSMGIQSTPKTRDFGCQAGDGQLWQWPEESIEVEEIEDDPADLSYCIESEEVEEDIFSETDDDGTNGENRGFFMVDKTKLLSLFSCCAVCCGETVNEVKYVGSMVTSVTGEYNTTSAFRMIYNRSIYYCSKLQLDITTSNINQIRGEMQYKTLSQK